MARISTSTSGSQVLLILALALTPACRHDGSVLTGDQGVTDDMNANLDGGPPDGEVIAADAGCFGSGGTCTTNAQCCSSNCDGTGHCAAGACMPAGAACDMTTDCCTLNCANQVCGSGQCISDGQSCTASGDACCSTQCVGGSCKPLNTTCKTAGNACPNGNGDCCSQLCTAGHCATPADVSYCTQPGDICYHDNDCCTGVCDGAAAGTAGTCATISTGCQVDGLACNGCTGCCSSFCAPFGNSGSKICQPASGCHVLGDLCHADTDCCGGAVTSGLPGAGLVKCIADPAHPQIGTCSQANPNNCLGKEATCKNSCQPEGDVCHFLGNGGCSSNSFPANCCGAPGSSKGVCKLDTLGVPRCYGLTACVMQGASCASSADCCNGLPCVPDSTGALTCSAMSCEPKGAICTTTADCCTGYECVIPPGSLDGTCTTPAPPGDMGAPPDLAGVDLAGTPPPDLAPPAPTCALYGQSCSTTVPCCNSASCQRSPANGGGACNMASYTDCVCYAPIL